MRKADLDLYDEIVGELDEVEWDPQYAEARMLFRLLNVCPMGDPTVLLELATCSTEEPSEERQQP